MTEDNLLEVLSIHGYAVLDMADPKETAQLLGRASNTEILRPLDSHGARSWSLSGTYGLGKFPWHTDAAISVNPPRWLILSAWEISEPTRTEILHPSRALISAMKRTVLRCTNSKGRVNYLPAVTPDRDHSRLRWDPRICVPQAGVSIEQMERQQPTARVDWREGRVLVIDNASVLHRRPAVSKEARRLLERIYVWSR